MIKRKRILSASICAIYIAAGVLIGAPIQANAASASPPPPLRGLSVKPSGINLNNAMGKTDITFTHDDPASSSPPGPLYPSNPAENDARYTARAAKYYFDEHNKGYKGKLPMRVYEDRRDPDFKPEGPYTVADLPSGMLYDVYATNYLEFEEYPRFGLGQRTTGATRESEPSNPALVFTGVKLDAQLAAYDQVRLTWDDVWYNGRRIYGYTINIYTSGDKDTRVLQGSIPIYQNQIGQSGPVTINEATGKLEYVYTVPYAGRVYSFEVVPALGDIPSVVAPEDNGVVTVASRIAVVAVKLFEDPVEDRITWEIGWSNVTAGMGNDRRYTAAYTLSKMGGGVSYQVLQVINNLTSTILVTPRSPDDPENAGAVYEISAIIYADGEEMYVGSDIVTITSGPFTLKESEAPYTPQTPSLQLEEVTLAQESAKADLWWSIPKQASDADNYDLDVSYEIFVLTDPRKIDALSDPKTSQDVQPDFVEDGAKLDQGPSKTGNVNGYVYSLDNLTPNTTYYAAVRAVKTFIDIRDMSFIKMSSQIAYVVFTTPPAGPGGQPPAPTAFELAAGSVTARSAEFIIWTLWYEQLDKSNGEPWEWVWRPDFAPEGDGLPDDFRKLSFEPGDMIYLYYAEYTPDMDPEKPESLPKGTYRTAIVPAIDEINPALRIPAADLTPNTIYIFWAAAARAGQPMSYPSKTIIVTTPPDPNTELETPTTPDFEIAFTGDTYADLLWAYRTDYEYSIQYALIDAFDGQDVKTVKTSAQEIVASGVDYYRVAGLEPDTVYYFRLRAETVSAETGEAKYSAWSDAKPTRTKPLAPPPAPSGFGIKQGADAITKNSIAYEWYLTAGIVYILEYSQGAEMTADTVEISVGAVSGYNLTGLLSNHRYYARLYALDTATGLRSAPTYIVGARTMRSDDDYDSNADITTPLTGEYVKIDAYAVEGVWNVRILGTDADRLAERILTDTYLDFSIDLSKPPRYTETICIVGEGKVFESLDKMRENLELKLSDKSFIIRPNTFSPKLASSPAANRVMAYRYEILIGLKGGAGYIKPGGMSLKTEPSGFDVNVLDGGVRYPITNEFGKGLRVAAPFTGAAWYTSGVTQGVYVDPDGVWRRLATTVDFNPDTRKGMITFEYNRPGSYFAADIGGRGLFADVSGGGYAEYINKLGALGITDTRAGVAFRPDDPATPAEAAGMLYRAMGYAGGGTGNAAASPATGANNDLLYLNSAYKAGFIADAGQTYIKVEEVLALVARAYAVRVGARVGGAAAGGAGADGQGSGLQQYAQGLADVPEPVRTYAQFALDNGLAAPVVNYPSEPFPAGRPATRGEVAAFICMALELLGEI